MITVVVTGPAGNCTSGIADHQGFSQQETVHLPGTEQWKVHGNLPCSGASVSNATKQSIVIYNSDGKHGIQQGIHGYTTYQLHNIDLRGYAGGVYYVVLRGGEWKQDQDRRSGY